MMRAMAIFLLLGAAALGLAGCQGDPRAERRRAGEAAINIGSDPRTLDPSLATDIASGRALMCFTRGLTVLDERGEPQPDLAESWQVSADGLTYDFKLRESAWSNGQRVTADDFVYAWTRRMLNPRFGAEYAYQLFYVKGAREFFEKPELGPASVWAWALAPDRLRVTLIAPTPFFPALLAHHAYYPVCRQADEANPKWAQRAETYVGCGPFKMTRYAPGQELVGEKHPGYWNAAQVGLKRLTLRLIEAESTERIAFENGEVDATANVPTTDLDALRGEPTLRFTNLNATYYLNLNCQKKPLDDARVRRALTLAINRAGIVRAVARARQTPAFSPTPPQLYTTPPEPTFKDADYAEARRLLAEAGYPGGRGFPVLRYIYNTLETHRAVAQVLQETWRQELGVRVQIENQEFKVLINNRRKGDFDIARAGWVADFPDPINFLEIYDSKSDNNDSHYLDPQFDAMLAACRAEADPARREELLRQAERYLMERAPIAPIYYQTRNYLVAPGLAGYWLNPTEQFDAARVHWAAEAPAQAAAPEKTK